MKLRIILNIMIVATLAICVAGCREERDPLDGLTVVGEDPTDLPVDGITPAQFEAFLRGDAIFEQLFRETEGIGPLYIRASCASCHRRDARGPGTVQRMVVVGADGAPSMDQSMLAYGSTVRPYAAAGATVPITPPDDPSVVTTIRFGHATFARGWLEAVDESSIRALADLQALPGSPVSGRLPLLEDGRLGRFGWKARTPTLEEFVADAFLGDFGLTSPARPIEPPNPEGISDDLVIGVDLPQETVDDLTSYVRTLAIPRRTGLTEEGRALFESVGCSNCHVPAQPTAADFQIAALAGRDAEIFTDMLLHDMGASLAAGPGEGAASHREWRTPPLIGLRHLGRFLHDGRAHSVEDVIAVHGNSDSEAAFAAENFQALDESGRAAFLDFVNRL